MPVIDGKVHRSRFTSLKLRELSSVDNPAQPGARMAIMKRNADKAYDPSEPRDDHGRWTADGLGITGLPHMVEGVDEMGFVPTMTQNESTGSGPTDYTPGTPVGARSRRMYDAAHDQLQKSFQLSPLEAHAVLTSRVGRHIANEISVGDGPGEIRAKIQAFAKNKGWSKSINDTAEAFSNGEGNWPVGIERLARTHKVREVAKYICTDDGAVSFQTVLADSKFDQNVWPCVDALSQSIRSIVGDSSLAGGERDAQINASVQQFLQSVRDISPEISKRLGELLVRKREGPMPKTVEELEKQVGELTGQLTSANALIVTEKARADAAEKAKADAMSAKDKADAECATTKAALVAATEETLKVGDVEVKKSEVGEAQFKLTKGLQDEATMARLEKRAGEEFPNLVGTTAEKAQVLKLVNGMAEDAPARKSLEAILTSAEKMIAQGFARLGGGGGQSPTQKAAEQTFKQKVAEIRKRDEISEHAAMTKARSEFPQEFAAAYPESSPAEQPAN